MRDWLLSCQTFSLIRSDLGDAHTYPLGFGLLLLANSLTAVLLATAFFALAYSVTNPALLALTSRRAAGSQGIAMGLSNSFVSLGRIVGPVLGGAVLDIDLRLPYITGAAMMLVGFAISLVWVSPGRREPATVHPKPETCPTTHP